MKTFNRGMLVFLVSGTISLNAEIIIGFDACQAVAGYTQSRMNAIAQFNFYFEHASVGDNMIAGLNGLHTDDATFYQLTSAHELVATPPATTIDGVVYEYMRGNPGWQSKINGFAADMVAWAGHTDFALNKFCYIDQEASLSAYQTSMTSLETTYPGTRFVYMTMPLTPDDSPENILRNEFNTQLRQWVIANDKVLYDVADIEAHDPSGIEQTFTDSGHTYQMLYSGYATDVAHLNDAGAELVAQGFYALGGAFEAVPEPQALGLGMGLACAAFVLWQRSRPSR